jgi:hypothetical protein
MEFGVVGINSRAAAASARKLGCRVHLVDYFRDVDSASDAHYPLQKDPLKPDLGGEYSKEKLVSWAIKKLPPEVKEVIPTSEVGCSPLLLKKLEARFRILGNGSAKVAAAKDWSRLPKASEKLGIKCPMSKTTLSWRGVKRAAEELGYPVVVKGVGVRAALFTSADELTAAESEVPDEGCVVQKLAEGAPVSASVLCDGKTAVTLSVNRQLIGLSELNAHGFTYCGNIVPAGTGHDALIAEKAAELVAALGLVGSNGVDFLLENGELILMEVNTRLQDTLECVEKYRGINLVDAHLKAVRGELVSVPEGCGCFGKAVLYAEKDSVVGDLWVYGGLGDVPQTSALVKKGEPVCSLYAEGSGPDEVLSRLKEKADEIKKSLLVE